MYLEVAAWKVMTLRAFQLTTVERLGLVSQCGYTVEDDVIHHLNMPDAIIEVNYETHKVSVVMKECTASLSLN